MSASLTGLLRVRVERPRWDEFSVSFELPPGLEDATCDIKVTDSLGDTHCLDTSPRRQHAPVYRYKLTSAKVNQTYTVQVAVSGYSVNSRSTVTHTGTDIFPIRKEYTKGELNELLVKAVHFYNINTFNMKKCDFFYRDKTPEYFDPPIMTKYAKDKNGDQMSPINCTELKGLFFGVNVGDNARPAEPSVYGRRRLLVPCGYFMSRTPKLYFADFYCIHRPHYVTLVLTAAGSTSDKFCSEKLVELDWYNNPFLLYNHLSDEMYVACSVGRSSKCWLEVLYTEDIDVSDVCRHGGELKTVACINEKRHGGKPKRPHYVCNECNLTDVPKLY